MPASAVDEHDDEEGIALSLHQEQVSDDGSEVMGFISSHSVNHFTDDFGDYDEEEGRCLNPFTILGCTMFCVLIIATLALLLPGMDSLSSRFSSLRNPARPPVLYKCPSTVNGDNHEGVWDENYVKASQQISDNITEFMNDFRHSNFDSWGHTYEQVKAGMYDFKSKYYSPNLREGDTIYESACGVGLNLYMTLEILQETVGLEHLIVYGNEYIPVSVDTANAVMDHVAPAKARKGVICVGDSENLDFVPYNSFDLVYTGYITPLADPIHFELPGKNDNDKAYQELCESNSSDWKGLRLNAMAQERQNDWYGVWVGEMARIAKLGVPVIVEQVSPTFCTASFDWGGVAKDFWYTAAKENTYNWDIDPESIVVEDDTIFRDRYHVFMRRNAEENVV